MSNAMRTGRLGARCARLTKRGRIVLLSLGTIFLTRLTAQSPAVPFPPILGFQPTGSASAWAWGKNTFAREVATRKFHLWHVNDGNITASILPPELGTPVEDLEPGVSFLNDQRGFVVWTEGRTSQNDEVTFTLATAETLDSGHSWQVRKQSINAGFTFTGINQVQFTDGQNGHVIVGIDAAAGSTFKTLLHTRDGGKHWQVDPATSRVVGNENAPIHMVFLSNSEGSILTAGVHGQPYPNISLCHTTDGGRTWDCYNQFAEPNACRPDCWIQDVSPVYFDPGNLREAFFFSHMYARTESLSARYRTHNEGASWSAPEGFHSPGRHWTFADFDYGLAQDGSRIFLTSDAGSTWSYNPALSRILSPYKSSMLRIELHRRERTLWLVAEVGDGSLLFHSEDGGSSWRPFSRK